MISHQLQVAVHIPDERPERLKLNGLA